MFEFMHLKKRKQSKIKNKLKVTLICLDTRKSNSDLRKLCSEGSSDHVSCMNFGKFSLRVYLKQHFTHEFKRDAYINESTNSMSNFYLSNPMRRY